MSKDEENGKSRKLSINEWNEEQRPRERLLSVGAKALTNAELLAILIHSGSLEKDAVALMTEVLESVDGSLDRLGNLTYDDLIGFKGIGPAKAVTILAASEFGRRRMALPVTPQTKFDTSEKIFQHLLKDTFWDLSDEECWVVLLNQSLHLISKVCIGKGGLTSVTADIRKIMKCALLKNSTCLVFAHNHPSGSVVPGKDDDATTQKIYDACKVMGLKLLDHIVVARNTYYSYLEEGRAPF